MAGFDVKVILRRELFPRNIQVVKGFRLRWDSKESTGFGRGMLSGGRGLLVQVEVKFEHIHTCLAQKTKLPSLSVLCN